MSARLLLPRYKNDDCGASAVEFALVAPVFVLILFGIMHFAIAFWTGASLQWAMEKAARDAMLDGAMTESQVQVKVDEYLSSVGRPITVDVDYSISTSTGIAIGTLSAQYTHSVNVPLLDPVSLPFSVEITVPQG